MINEAVSRYLEQQEVANGYNPESDALIGLFSGDPNLSKESEDNIGKMVVIDVETGEYGVDKSGIRAAIALKDKNPNARLFTIRIGYDVAISFGGNFERVTHNAGQS